MNSSLASLRISAASHAPFITEPHYSQIGSIFVERSHFFRQVFPFFFSNSAPTNISIINSVFSSFSSNYGVFVEKDFTFVTTRSTPSTSLAFTNTVFTNISTQSSGGCVYSLTSGLSFSFIDCTFFNCYSYAGGGAMYIYQFGSFTLVDSCYYNCSSDFIASICAYTGTTQSVNYTSETATIVEFGASSICSLYGGATNFAFHNNNISKCSSKASSYYGTLWWFFPVYDTVGEAASFNTMIGSKADTIFGFNLQTSSAILHSFNVVNITVNSGGGLSSVCCSALTGYVGFHNMLFIGSFPSLLIARVNAGSLIFSFYDCVFTDSPSSILSGLTTSGCTFGVQVCTTYQIDIFGKNDCYTFPFSSLFTKGNGIHVFRFKDLEIFVSLLVLSQ